jgi:hypothetical protein
VNKVFWSVEGRFFDDRHENNERGDTCCVVCVCEKWWWNCACYRLPCQFSWACELAEPQEKSNGAWKSHVYYLRVKDLWSDVQMTHTVRRPRAIIVFSTTYVPGTGEVSLCHHLRAFRTCWRPSIITTIHLENRNYPTRQDNKLWHFAVIIQRS